MKKILLVLVLFVSAGVSSAFAWGIGGAFNLGVTDSAIPGAALTVKPPNSSLVFGLGATLGSNVSVIGLTADYWAVNAKLVDALNYYVGFGGYLTIVANDNNNALGLGGRIPVGLNIFPIKPLELFLEVAPTIGVGLGDPVTFPVWGLQGAFGFRFWF